MLETYLALVLDAVVADTYWAQVTQLVILIVTPAAIIVARKIEKEPIDISPAKLER
jgi:hypothetical protein